MPRWVPRIGGRPVPTKPVVAAVLIGAGVLMALWTPLLLWWIMSHADMTAAGANVVGILYLPLVCVINSL